MHDAGQPLREAAERKRGAETGSAARRYVRAMAIAMAPSLAFGLALSLLIWRRTLPPLPGLMPGVLGWCMLSGGVPLLNRRSPFVLVLFGAMLGLPALALTLAVNFKVVRVEGESMLPHLHPGDVLLVDLRASPEQFASPGHEVWMLEVEGEPENPLVKRLVGAPGQVLEARYGRLYADGREVHPRLPGPASEFLEERGVYEGGYLRNGMRVEEGRYFFLGDNPQASRDGRHFGPVSPDAVRGRVVWRLKGSGGFGRLGE